MQTTNDNHSSRDGCTRVWSVLPSGAHSLSHSQGTDDNSPVIIILSALMFPSVDTSTEGLHLDQPPLDEPQAFCGGGADSEAAVHLQENNKIHTEFSCKEELQHKVCRQMYVI